MTINVVDLIKIKVLSTGTGALSLGDAVAGYRGLEGLTNGLIYSYSIQQGSDYEIGKGTYLASGNLLVRSPTQSSNGGAALDLQPNATVAFVLLAADLAQIKQGPAGAPGPAGPAGNVAATLADLKAAPITNGTMLYDQATFTWTAGDYSATDPEQLDVNVVASDDNLLSDGAWIRQTAAKVALTSGDSLQYFVDLLLSAAGMGAIGAAEGETGQQALDHGGRVTVPGTGAVPVTTAASVAQTAIVPAHFGVAFDGTDQSAKVQAMIDAAAEYSVPIYLNGGIIGIGATLDLKGRYVEISGAGANNTVLRATTSMGPMFDAQEASDVVVSPFSIKDLRIDCNDLASMGYAMRYRHYTKIDGVYILNATDSGIWEKDTWNNYRSRVTVHGSPIGVNLIGSNHNSVWSKCSFNTNTDTQLVIGNAGTANDGNMGLLFDGCDVEFGGPGAKGITTAASTSATFTGCYLGENIEGAVIENQGHVLVKGGVLFWGILSTSYLIRPLAGRLMIEGAQLNGQAYGTLSNLSYLSPTEVAAAAYGKFKMKDIAAYIGSGSGILPGDVLAPIPGTSFAPRYGQDFTAASFDGAVTSSISGSSITMTVTTPGTTNLNELHCPLQSGWRKGKPVFYALVYEATRSTRVKFATSAFGSNQFVYDLPATTGPTTFFINGLTPDPDAYTLVELTILSSVAGDTLTVHKQAFCDYGFLDCPSGASFGNLGLAA